MDPEKKGKLEHWVQSHLLAEDILAWEQGLLEGILPVLEGKQGLLLQGLLLEGRELLLGLGLEGIQGLFLQNNTI